MFFGNLESWGAATPLHCTDESAPATVAIAMRPRHGSWELGRDVDQMPVFIRGQELKSSGKKEMKVFAVGIPELHPPSKPLMCKRTSSLLSGLRSSSIVFTRSWAISSARLAFPLLLPGSP